MNDFYLRIGKRALDILIAGVSLIVFFPLFCVVAVCIYVEDRGPVLFEQHRSGFNGKVFRLLKFRSMAIDNTEVPSTDITALRITRTGRIIRRTNIDELPQLINILFGDMSVVGPRPALLSQEQLLSIRRENGAIKLKPGLTGMAQLNAYDGMSEVEKGTYDGIYLTKVSLVTDIWLILRTFVYLLKRPPVY